MENIGDILKKTRIEQSISLDEIEEKTKIRKYYLEALENEEWNKFPGRAYLRAFLRKYANYLGLDEDRLLDSITHDVLPLPQNEKLQKTIELPGKPKNKIAIFFAVIAIILLLSFQYFYNNFRQNVKDISSKDSNTSILTEATQPSVIDPGIDISEELQVNVDQGEADKLELKVKVVKNSCWMEIADGEYIVYVGTLRAGEEIIFTEMNNIRFRLGNAGDTEVYINGKLLMNLGISGQVVSKEYNLINGKPEEVIR